MIDLNRWHHALQGYVKRTLLLPPPIRIAWERRERSSSSAAPLGEEYFDGDMIDILLGWSLIWLNPRREVLAGALKLSADAPRVDVANATARATPAKIFRVKRAG
jgi:hypothetical protein